MTKWEELSLLVDASLDRLDTLWILTDLESKLLSDLMRIRELVTALAP